MSKDKHHNKTHYLQLHFGSWLGEIPEEEVLVFISIALNYCVHNEEIKIKGYLITRSHLYLVMTSHKHSVHHVLTVLSEQTKQAVYLKVKDEEDEEVIYLSDQYSMFTKHPLQDYDLIKLIIGKDVKLPYHSPRIAYLKKITHNYNYCSVPDYKDAIGPVLVDTHIKKEQ